MSKVMREDDVREVQIAELLAQVDDEGAIVLERAGGAPPLLLLPLGQPGRAAASDETLDDLKRIRSALQGQPGRAGAVAQIDGLITTLGQPGRA